MLNQIRVHDAQKILNQAATLDEIDRLATKITNPVQNTFSGDIYEKIQNYVPLGNCIGKFVRFIGERSIWDLFFNCRDWFIPNDYANVYPFKIPDTNLQNAVVETVGEVTNDKYPSKAFEIWSLRT